MSVRFPVDLAPDDAFSRARQSVGASSCLTVPSTADPRLYDEVALDVNLPGGHVMGASGQVVRFVPDDGGFEVYLLPASLELLRGVFDGTLTAADAARQSPVETSVAPTGDAPIENISIDQFMGTGDNAASSGPSVDPDDLDTFDPIPSEFSEPDDKRPPGGGGVDDAPEPSPPAAIQAEVSEPEEIELDGFDEFIIDEEPEAPAEPPSPPPVPEPPLFESAPAGASSTKPEAEPEPEPVPIRELLDATSDVPIGVQFQNLALVDQLRLAREGDKYARSVAIRFGNKRLHIDVVQNKSITLEEIAALTARPGLTERAIRWIIQNPRMVGRRDIVMNLVVNPKTPREAAIKAVRVLKPAELAHLLKCPWTPKVIRATIERRLNEARANAR